LRFRGNRAKLNFPENVRLKQQPLVNPTPTHLSILHSNSALLSSQSSIDPTVYGQNFPMRLYDEITMSSSNEMASLQTSIILNI
jgi:hypothetical protein